MCRAGSFLLENRLERRPDVVGDDPRAGGGRMDAVALVQRFDTGNTVQQKWDESDVILLGQRRIDLMKRDDIRASEVRRRFHSGEDHFSASRPATLDDVGE